MAQVVLTPEDEKALAIAGVSRSSFVATREAELKTKAARRPPHQQAAGGPVVRARADMAAPCPNCQHLAAHPCSAASCNCNGTVPRETPTDALTATDREICGRLGVAPSAFLKARRQEARP